MNINNHWSKYWQSGAQTSLPDDFKNNYEGEIYDFWQQRVTALRSGDKVLDVCTGNGAVALLLAEIALKQKKILAITAIDISEINTEFIKQKYPSEILSQIKFISHCPLSTVEQVITEPQELIVSQYGLEYTDLTLTSVVIYKILKSQGELAFIAHSADGDVFRYMEKEQSIYQWLSDIGILQIIKSFLKQQSSANSFKNKLYKIVESNQPPIEYHGQPLLLNWQKTLTMLLKGNNQFLKQQRPSLSNYMAQNQAAWLRAKDMVAVGHKLADKDWTQPLIGTGFKQTETKPILYKQQHLAGLSQRFVKP